MKLILIESEFPIDWALELPKSDAEILGELFFVSKKYKVERAIFKEAAIAKGKKIFDYNFAFNLANKIVLGEDIKIEI